MIKFAVLLLLVFSVINQNCPYCEYNACTTSVGGISNCTQCISSAALLTMQIPADNLHQAIYMGTCQLCPLNCATCQYGVLTPAMSTPVPSINCTSCNTGYVHNYAFGNCTPCPSNCGQCQCMFDTCSETYCTACNSGYNLTSSNTCVLDSTVNSVVDPTDSGQNNGAIIGLSVWGGVMTVLSVLFIVLWLRKRKEERLAAKQLRTPALGGETKQIQV